MDNYTDHKCLSPNVCGQGGVSGASFSNTWYCDNYKPMDYTDIEIKAAKKARQELLEEIEKHLVELPGVKYYWGMSKKSWGKMKRYG